MMVSKSALIWPDFGFYHVVRFHALHKKLGNNILGIELIGGEGEDETTKWRYRERGNLPIVTLFPHSNISDLSRKKLGLAIVKKLEEWKADAIFVNGYSVPEFRIVIDWAWKKGKKCFTFSETKRDDFRRFFWKELIKKSIIKKLSGAICGGKLQKEYLMELGMPESRIFLGYDAVDNNFFIEKSKLARENREENRTKYNLPENYFLTCSRFVKKKNLSRLLSAYKMYREKTKDRASWDLVLCGTGSQEPQLKEKVERENIKNVVFAGSKKPDELAIYYGLASCFVLASTTEQWGLVVNEAMASGLPVLVTKVAGAASELVEDGVNGYTFDPYKIEQISALMIKMTSLGKEKLLEMGKRNQQRIGNYSPEYFAESVIKAISV